MKSLYSWQNLGERSDDLIVIKKKLLKKKLKIAIFKRSQ